MNLRQIVGVGPSGLASQRGEIMMGLCAVNFGLIGAVLWFKNRRYEREQMRQRAKR